MKELNDLNNIYQSMYAEDENKGYVVTNADKKGNTPAWQGYKAGKKKKDGKPMYRAADHLKNESVGTAVDKTLGAAGEIADTAIKAPVKAIGYVAGLKKGLKKQFKKGQSKANEGYEATKKKEVLGAMEKQGRKLSKKDKNKIADKVVKDKGDTSKSDDRYAYEEYEVTAEFKKLIESGLFSDEELVKMLEGNQRDPEGSKKDRTHSSQPDPSKDGFTGIGNMSIKDIMKMNAKIKAKKAKK